MLYFITQDYIMCYVHSRQTTDNKYCHNPLTRVHKNEQERRKRGRVQLHENKWAELIEANKTVESIHYLLNINFVTRRRWT